MSPSGLFVFICWAVNSHLPHSGQQQYHFERMTSITQVFAMDIKKRQPVIDIPPVVWQVYSQLGASRAEGSQIPKSRMLLCVMAKSCPFSVGEIPPHLGHPHQLAVMVLNENTHMCPYGNSLPFLCPTCTSIQPWGTVTQDKHTWSV